MSDRSGPIELSVLICGFFVPWLVLQNAPGDVTAVMAWGLVNTNPFSVFDLNAYLNATQGFDSLPRALQLWPIGAGFYVGAIVSAASGVFLKREDPRVTGSLLVLATIASLWLWSRFAFQTMMSAIPVAPIVFLFILWWFYWPVLKNGMPASQP
ncbi:TIGR04206 family protein [Natronocalculus amylovorans]|uniref:TIGR04206 family protein n=1 Tax=Natronocalculus amylovorans TaxID=2917812 RepID=A0AAE3FYT3_9EURY|nr:TIGR04206 family protein [Natronocalculus amylovorans]MCL9817671.1 TIGR04206 family protein [Natronocalculus amylovorans]